MHKIKGLLDKHEIPSFLCEPVPGKDIVEVTKEPAVAAECFDLESMAHAAAQSVALGWAVYGSVAGLASNQPLLQWCAHIFSEKLEASTSDEYSRSYLGHTGFLLRLSQRMPSASLVYG